MPRPPNWPALLIDGTRVRKSPFFEATRRYGCKAFDVYNHMYIPDEYGDPVEEYWHLVKHVTLWDVAVERVVEISGPDATRFTDMLTCRDLSKCKVGQGRYMLVLAPDGGIVNDPVLMRLEENRWWMALADSDAGLYALGVSLNAGMKVKVSYPEAYPVQVQGPKSRDVVRALFGDRVLDLGYYRTMQAQVEGIPVLVARTGWTAELGYEIYLLDGSRGDDLWERIMEAGKPHSIRPTGPSDLRRMEAGIFNYGSDMTLENNPYEVTGLERLVEDKRADYVGKEALRRIEAEGVRRKLVGIEIGGDPLPERPDDFWPVLVEGRTGGRVTNAVHSPRLRKNIGYAWVPVDRSQTGSRLEIDAPFGRLAASVVPMPFLDPKKDIPRS